MFALTGYQNNFHVRGIFHTRKECQKYLNAIMTKEEIKYLIVKIVNNKEVEKMQKQGIKILV